MNSIYSSQAFAGKNGLIIGVANERSLAWAIAQQLRAGGARLAFTYLGDSLKRRVEPLAQEAGSDLILPLDVQNDSQMSEVFSTLSAKMGKLDYLIHSVAFANREDLEGRFSQTSREGFLKAMDISCYSLIACARAAEGLMEKAGGGSIITLSYYGGEKVVPNYNVMGVAKAALESSVRYLAYDLGPKKIRVNAISAGPVKTLAAAGIRDFRTMLNAAAEKTPLKENISASGVGSLAAFLCSEEGRYMTGTTTYVDSGAHIMA